MEQPVHGSFPFSTWDRAFRVASCKRLTVLEPWKQKHITFPRLAQLLRPNMHLDLEAPRKRNECGLGRLVLDMVMPARYSEADPLAVTMDLGMLKMGGKERTEAGFSEIFRPGGIGVGEGLENNVWGRRVGRGQVGEEVVVDVEGCETALISQKYHVAFDLPLCMCTYYSESSTTSSASASPIDSTDIMSPALTSET